MAFPDIETHRRDLGLRGGQAGDRHLARVEPDVGIGLVEVDRPLAHDGRENHVGSKSPDILHDRQEVLPTGMNADITLSTTEPPLALSSSRITRLDSRG